MTTTADLPLINSHRNPLLAALRAEIAERGSEYTTVLVMRYYDGVYNADHEHVAPRDYSVIGTVLDTAYRAADNQERSDAEEVLARLVVLVRRAEEAQRTAEIIEKGL